MKKELVTKLAVFIGGTVFGSIGLKLLSSKDAKNLYAHIAAAGFRMKDCALDTVDKVQASAEDVLAQAKDINAKREEVFDDTFENVEEDTVVVE